MNRDNAKLTLLIRAVELADRMGVVLPLAVRDHCTREAAPPTIDLPDQTPPSGSVSAAEEAFLARRAALLEGEIRQRSQALAALDDDMHLSRPVTLVLCLLALGLGLASQWVSQERQLNLLDFPLLGLIAWNILVYVLLFVHWLLPLHFKSSAGPLITTVARWLTRMRVPERSAAVQDESQPDRAVVTAKATMLFLSDWVPLQLTAATARARTLLHACALLFALGVSLGLMAHGVSREYLAGWESTWFDADTVGHILRMVLGPASAVTGVALPDRAGIEALGFRPGFAGVNAGTWILLYVVSAALYVVLPRAVLMLWNLSREARLNRAFYSPRRDDRYIRLLLQANRGTGEVAAVLWHGVEPTPERKARVRDSLRERLGGQIQLEFLEPIAYGEEASIQARLARGATREHVVVVFSLAATPEDEIHGEVLRQLAAHASLEPGGAPIVLLDAAPLARFAEDAAFRAHYDDRLRTWELFAAHHHASTQVLPGPRQPTSAQRAPP